MLRRCTEAVWSGSDSYWTSTVSVRNTACWGQVLDRGERIELLVDKTDHLQSESFAFNREARVLRRRLWWKNARLLAAAGALVLLIVYVIVAVACSPTFQC